jgi:hypothetical protein
MYHVGALRRHGAQRNVTGLGAGAKHFSQVVNIYCLKYQHVSLATYRTSQQKDPFLFCQPDILLHLIVCLLHIRDSVLTCERLIESLERAQKR